MVEPEQDHWNAESCGALAPALEAEMRTLARKHFAGERVDHTLQPTALVSEVWLKFAQAPELQFTSIIGFRAWASQVIRHILVDHARRKRAAKRGSGVRPRLLTPLAVGPSSEVDVLLFDDLLARLSSENPRAGSVVEMRFFGGMTEPQTARHLGVSERTVRTDWAFARAWLRAALEDAPPERDPA